MAAKLLGEFHHARIIKIRAGNVDQFGGLFLNRGDNSRMAMPGGDDGDARGKIQEHVAVHVFDHRAAARFRHQRITARVGRRNELCVARDQLSSPWDPGGRVTRCGQFRISLSVSWILRMARPPDVLVSWHIRAAQTGISRRMACRRDDAKLRGAVLKSTPSEIAWRS